MTLITAKKHRIKMDVGDWATLLPLLSARDIDYPRVTEMIEELYGDVPELAKIARTAVINIRRVHRGDAPNISRIKFLHSKSVLGFLINTGHLDVALEVLKTCKAQWKPDYYFETESMLTLAPSKTVKTGQVDHPWVDWHVIDRKSRTTFVFFCGIGGRFGVELNAISLWLHNCDCNIVYARDFNKSLYLSGIKSLGAFSESITAIKSSLESLGSDRVVCLGSSGGVLGSLLYGEKLNADKVICFAGPTTLDQGFDAMEDRPVYEIVYQKIQNGEIDMPQPVSMLRNSGIPVRYFYGADNQFDSAQATQLKDVQNVTLEPLSGWAGHFVLGELARRGQLEDIFKQAVTGG